MPDASPVSDEGDEGDEDGGAALAAAPPRHAPLIVTADLPPPLQARADALRRAHFPPERNHLSAHVTLFHALPPSSEGEVRRLLARLAAETPPPPAQLGGIMDLGGGTALRIEAPAMIALRAEIAAHFHGLLSAQDNQRPRLHVTIQNKVARAEARALQSALSATFRAETFAFAALSLHRYRGGPWEPAGRWPFRGRRG